MKINLKAINIEITQTMRDYIEKRVTNLGKLISKLEEKGSEAQVYFEVSKTTNHHKSGEVFRAHCTIELGGTTFDMSATDQRLEAAIDEVKDNLFREIHQKKDRNTALYRRGAAKIKDMLKGITNFRKK